MFQATIAQLSVLLIFLSAQNSLANPVAEVPAKASVSSTAVATPTVSSAASSTVAVASKNIKFKSEDGKTEFTAIGKPAMIKIAGEGDGPEGFATFDKNIVQMKVKVNLTKMTTKIELRDEHMKNKYLEVQKFPTAELIIKDLSLKQSVESLTENFVEVPFSGDLTLHGKTKMVEGVASVAKKGKVVLINADFSIKIMEHLDTLPSWAGIKVADEVKIKVQLKGLIQ